MVTKRITLNELKTLVKQIIKEEARVNEGVIIGKSKLGQQAANTLNQLISKINRPDLQTKARALAGQLISLIDDDSSQ